MSPQLLIAPVSLAGALITYRVNHDLKIGPVRASSGATLAFCLLSWPIGYSGMPALRAAFFGSTFVGMATADRFTARQVSVGALVYAGIYALVLAAPGSVREPGGVLGTSAFLAGVSVAAADLLWAKVSERRARRNPPDKSADA